MNKTFGIIIIFTSFFILQRPVFAIETSPPISDREIVEAVAEMRGDIKRLDSRIDSLHSEIIGRFEGVDHRFEGINHRFEEINHRFEEINHRFEEINHRFDALQWTLGLFITIALVILGFVLRMQWQMHRRQAQMETILGTQRDEISFIKSLIEKLMPPKGVL